ncbi:MAG: metallophosphoesterase [Candidatus Korobacteraceae bacterium]
MFLRIILLIWTGLHVYVFYRLSSIPIIVQHVPNWLLVVVAAILWMSYMLARFLDRSGLGTVARPLEIVGANWIGILFLIFVGLLVADIATGFGLLFPRIAPTLRSWALLASLVLCVIGTVQARRAPAIRNYEVQLANLPPESNGTVLVLATDLHLGALLGERWLAGRVAQIQAERPDLVIFGGDILEGHHEAHRKFLPLLRRISPPLGLWAVTGNHEFYGGFETSVRLLEDAGFRVLRDQWAEVRPGLLIAGVDDLTARRRFGQDGNFVEQALAGRPANAATIFVSHTPWEAERAARAGAGLMLCGHTHNGQIWPFTYIVRLIHPLLGGRYEVNGMPVIVCRGTGTWGPRLRLWRRSEIVRVTLRSPVASSSTR